MEPNKDSSHPGFWNQKRVYLTGHTGFKGSWLSHYLLSLGAQVAGYALPPPTTPSLFELSGLADSMRHTIGDILDYTSLIEDIRSFRPEIVFHLAAQALVFESYRKPSDTFATNVMGTVYLLEAIRHSPGIRAVVVITSDKCYENREWQRGYRETDTLGGFDPYSTSKACAELVTQCFRRSFFPSPNGDSETLSIATARSGNVIGGGDWAPKRLVPDCLRAMEAGEQVVLRNPESTRPWQHVLDSLSGYLLLAERLFFEGCAFQEAWNFGPLPADEKPVLWIVQRLLYLLKSKAEIRISNATSVHEGGRLALDCSKAISRLGWVPLWDVEAAVAKTAQWILNYRQGKPSAEICRTQIREYEHEKLMKKGETSG